MTGLIYTRTVTLERTTDGATPGAQGYSGLTAAKYSQVGGPWSAGVQKRNVSGKNYPNVPSDPGKVRWEILVYPPMPAGTILERDVFVDDIGDRYLVLGVYVTLLNTQTMCERLEA